MNLLPKITAEFAQKDYWEKFFDILGTRSFEWYGEYWELKSYLNKYIKIKDGILVVGCGNSNVSVKLHELGYNLVNIDISDNVVEGMLKQYPKMRFQQMDALSMTFEDSSFSVVFDKGTLDALMVDESEQTLTNIDKYFNEISRVLRLGGRYICISLLEQHILKRILFYFAKSWALRIVRCREIKKSQLPVFMVICTKMKNIPEPILEVALNGSDLVRYNYAENVTTAIDSVQKAEMACYNLYRGKPRQIEKVFEFFNPVTNTLRFSVIVCNLEEPVLMYGQFAVFVVPVGRGIEWLFSTERGRQKLLVRCAQNLMAFVFLQRNESYGTHDDIRKEINANICPICPPNVTTQIPILHPEDNLEPSLIKYKGYSKISGPYIIEDVTIKKCMFRRLIFLKRDKIIQTEMIMVQDERGLNFEVSSTYDVQICITISYLCNVNANVDNNVLIIGLGGGTIPSFLLEKVPNINLTVVELDEEMLHISKSWFNLNSRHENLDVIIEDGVKFLQKCAQDGKKFNIILFDVDSKDVTSAISCPPKEFLGPATLSNTEKCLATNGVFLLNFVCRDSTVHTKIKSKLQTIFGTVYKLTSPEDLNEILICTRRFQKFKKLKNQIVNFSRSLFEDHDDITKAFETLEVI